MTALLEAAERRPLASALAAPLAPGVAMSLWWLGQAGFAVRCGGSLVLVDPYLSDYLARHGEPGGPAPVRLMPPPVRLEDLPPVDAVLCSHAHGDHMDPETLTVVAQRSPRCRFLLPRAERAAALDMGVPPERIEGMADGDTVAVGPGAGAASVEALPSAHYERSRDAQGADRFLGFVVRGAGARLYHSGDCIPWPGLAERLAPLSVHLALLPINGRDEERTAAGIIGNFDLAEAVELCRCSGIPALVGHHYGLFAFNTVRPESELVAIGGEPRDVRVLFARTLVRIDISTT